MPTPPLSVEKCQQAVDAVAEHGSIQRASEALNLNRGTLEGRLREARRRGFRSDKPPLMVLKGQSILRSPDGTERARWDKTKLQGREVEDTVQLPDPKKIHKVSTLYDQQGRVQQQWVAEKPEDSQREALWTAFAEGLGDKIKRATPTAAPKHTNDELLTVYPVGDHHNGMYSWAKETGADYDLAIAEKLLCDAFDRLIAGAPASERALIPFLGDFFHYDSYESVTPTNRHLLDADSRYPKMIDAGRRQIEYAIDRALQKHKSVHLIFEPGNHDPSTTAIVAIFVAAHYRNEPRVTVDTSPAHAHYFEWESVLIGTTHGDRVKAGQLPGIMATDMPEAWGRTKHRRWLTGHVHHETLKEYPGCFVESLGVLAAPDAYAANNFYRSTRQMQALVFHWNDGLIERHTVNPGMFDSKVAA